MINTPKEIKTITDFAGLEPGQVVVIDDKEAVYAGLRWIRTCSCCNVPNCFQFPHIVRTNEKGGIELVRIRSMEEPRPNKITNVRYIDHIDESHVEYQALKNLLVAARMILE
jgi:hypothetical protein